MVKFYFAALISLSLLSMEGSSVFTVLDQRHPDVMKNLYLECITLNAESNVKRSREVNDLIQMYLGMNKPLTPEQVLSANF